VVGGRAAPASNRLTPAGIRALSGRRAAWRDFSATVTRRPGERHPSERSPGGHGHGRVRNPRLIRGYLEVLAAQLAGVRSSMSWADGLTETYRSYRTRGLPG